MKIKSGPVIHEINMLKLLILGPIFEELNDSFDAKNSSETFFVILKQCDCIGIMRG